MMFVDVLFPNDDYDDDDIQMSSNIDIDVANVYSWSIIRLTLNIIKIEAVENTQPR